MKNYYNLIVKTGDAEIRAFEKSSFNLSKVFPIIELTRGRKSKYDKVGVISKRIEKISKIFKDQTVCFDLTTDESLGNEQITELYSYENGYKNWIVFLNDLKEKEYFKEIVPTILVNTEDDNLEDNLIKQVEQLSSFSSILYRNNLTDDGYIDDINAIKNEILANTSQRFLLVFDCEYVPVGAVHNVTEVLDARIKKVKSIIPKVEIIIAATSFPRYVSDIGNDSTDIFPLDELKLYDQLKDNKNVFYGDYGSVNPERNDTITMARGWIPRIDVPTLSGIYYHRKRRATFGNDYSLTYSAVAKDIVSDKRFPSTYEKNWGIQQIIKCAKGDAPGSSPSFWISVRISIYITMQLNRQNNIR